LKRALSLAVLLTPLGCFSMPTPLAPGLSGSIGAPNHGVLTDGEELPTRGPGFVRYRPLSPHYFGRPGLVHTIERAASAVASRFPGGAPLFIGDLSAQTGGRIPGHDSHRSGRDADLLFYVTTPAGVPVSSPGFVHFEADGLALVEETNDYVRLDVEREWLLVRSLLESPEVGVQFLFASREIEGLLIDYARARNEPPELLWHAETVLLQPTDSLPHDDHLHLRVSCSPEDSLAGCSGGGPRWEWLKPDARPEPLDAASLSGIAHDDPFQLEPPAETATAGPGGA
jgi:penicillin-insensitive murein endopeptidase